MICKTFDSIICKYFCIYVFIGPNVKHVSQCVSQSKYVRKQCYKALSLTKTIWAQYKNDRCQKKKKKKRIMILKVEDTLSVDIHRD